MSDATPKRTPPVKKKAPVKKQTEAKTPLLPDVNEVVNKLQPSPLMVGDLGEEFNLEMTDEELVVAFNRLKKRLDDERKYRRTTTFAITLAVVIAITLGLAVIGLKIVRDNDRVDQGRNACNLGNEFREQIRDLGSTLNDRADNAVLTLIAASQVANRGKVQTPQEEKQGEEGLNEFIRLSNLDSEKVKTVISNIKDADCQSLYH